MRASPPSCSAGAALRADPRRRLSEAAQQLSEQRLDAVLLDLMLPDFSGLATVDSVQDHAPTCRSSCIAASGRRTCCSPARWSAAAPRSSCPRAWPRRRDAARHPRLDRAQAPGAAQGPFCPPRSADGARQPPPADRALRARGRPRRAPRLAALLSIELDHYRNVVEQMGTGLHGINTA